MSESKIERPSFSFDNVCYLTPSLRTFLLETILLRLDVKDFACQVLELELVEDGEEKLKGNCPFCGGEESFSLHKKSGSSSCHICLEERDLFFLVRQFACPPTPVMNDVLMYFNVCIRVAEQRKAKRRQK
jgi:hypothetical protein